MLQLMILTLNFSLGSKKFVLIKPDKLKTATKSKGFIFINKHFVNYFIQDIDKMHDLNI